MHSGPSYFAELTIGETSCASFTLRGGVSTMTGLWRKLCGKRQAIALRRRAAGSLACGCLWVGLNHDGVRNVWRDLVEHSYIYNNTRNILRSLGGGGGYGGHPPLRKVVASRQILVK